MKHLSNGSHQSEKANDGFQPVFVAHTPKGLLLVTEYLKDKSIPYAEVYGKRGFVNIIPAYVPAWMCSKNVECVIEKINKDKAIYKFEPKQ